jgi:hypothetical protein
MSSTSEHKEDFIIRPDYISSVKVYDIIKPAIETGYVYNFTSDSGLFYEVRFAPKVDNILGMVVNFTVDSDEFENDYPVTNRGEVFNIIATVIEIVRIFHHYHNFTTSYEFSGEFKENESKTEHNSSIRSRMYLRYAPIVLTGNWKAQINGNKVLLKKVK